MEAGGAGRWGENYVKLVDALVAAGADKKYLGQ